ncbi:MAG: methylated-DNA--[protein]-cysteine S-methyltransferase [Nitrospinae bacterium]|nr:methylated-DNA--[protein]-cysteine S-methyltransferase [Nitrospinota bacterium]
MVESIAVGSLDSPIGALWAACSERGVCRVVFPREGEKQSLERWFAGHMPTAERITRSALLEQTFKELVEYFDGTRHRFTLPLDLRGNSFEQRAWGVLTHIPYGQTVSYGSIARQLNDPQAARAVGAACGANPVPIIVP